MTRMDRSVERGVAEGMRERSAAKRLLASAREATDGGMVSVRADDLEALKGVLEAVASGSGHGGGVRYPDDVEHYDISATVYRRSPYDGSPDGEWVLMLQGSIGDTSFSSAHPAPIALAPQDVPGLSHLYDAIDAGVPEPDSGWTVRDPAYLAGLAKGLGRAAGIVAKAFGPGRGTRPPEVEGALAEIEAALPLRPDYAYPRHPEFDLDDVQVALEAFRRINPTRKMREETVSCMLEAVSARRAPIIEGLLDDKARTSAAFVRAMRSAAEADARAARRDEAFAGMALALRRCLPLLADPGAGSLDTTWLEAALASAEACDAATRDAGR